MASRTYPFDLASRVLSERLHGRTASDELEAVVRGQSIDWDAVMECASTQYVLSAFAAALRDLDLVQFMEEELAAFLAVVHAANLERNCELRDELSRAVTVLNRVDIEPVLLKGAIRLVDNLYPDCGWRMLRDLDLLIPKASLARARRALGEAGYVGCGSDGEVRRNRGACQVDLHTELFCTPRQVRLLQAVEVLENARSLVIGNGRVFLPSIEHQLVHLIGHGQLRHLGHAFGRITLRNRLEAAALVCSGSSEIEWQAVFARFVASGYRRPLLSLLLALNEGGWCAVPIAARIDPLTALQQHRIGLQATSPTFAYIGSRVGWCISTFTSQIEEADGGERKGISNLKRLIVERGAIGRMARSFMSRGRHLMHGLPYMGWLPLQ